ncbi:MAG: 4-hydroxybenzoyl-CoA thioesterase [Acidimicrobiia bacterium]|nr:4-hydroxybenzoyl-CoA thioesterase [Acidimicrobiia bacterium]MYE67016.1 4-hydroxybenzoyl-CoA thioesterase [Acidimicrobiia bacterium]MYJ12934.1 4-hydroxybenzoyl-CoA thioesterase [Acidimicrobiia bacterium]
MGGPPAPAGLPGQAGPVLIGAGVTVRAVARVVGAGSLQPLPATGRLFSDTRRVRLDEAGPDGLLRLDALACHLQDIATDDYLDAGFGDDRSWVLRRLLVAVGRPAGFDETLDLTTWCSGLGSRWAERSTRLRGTRGAEIDAVALWVHLDPDTGIPRRLADQFEETFGPSAGGRRVGASLLHPPPTNDAGSANWAPRWCDLDVLDHVNNAAYWTAVLEEAATVGLKPPYRAEIEHRTAVGGGEALHTPVCRETDGTLRMWFLNEAGVCASALVGPEPSSGAAARADSL